MPEIQRSSDSQSRQIELKLNHLLFSLLVSDNQTQITSKYIKKQLANILPEGASSKIPVNQKIILSRILIRAHKNYQDAFYYEYLIKNFDKKELERIMSSTLETHALINGKTGWLLLLIHIYAYLKEEWMLKEIQKQAYLLIQKLFPLDRKKMVYISELRNMGPLCGVQYGNSGIALIFFQLGAIFNNNTFFSIAKKLMRYEDEFLSSSQNLWPDFRVVSPKATTKEGTKVNYLKKTTSHLAKTLSIDGKDSFETLKVRLLAYKYTNTKSYLNLVIKMLPFLKGVGPEDVSLLYYELYVLTDNPVYRKKAIFIFHSEIKKKPNFLEILFNQNVFKTSLLLPVIEKEDKKQIINYTVIIDTLLRNHFFYTLRIAEEMEPDVIKKFVHSYPEKDFEHTNHLNAFRTFLKEYLKVNKPYSKIQCSDILEFEFYKIQLLKNIEGIYFLDSREMKASESLDLLMNLAEADLLNTQLVCADNLHFYKTDWKWVDTNNELHPDRYDVRTNLNQKSQPHYNLLKASSFLDIKRKTFIHEKLLSEYEYLILDLFEYPVKVHEVFNEFINLFDISSRADFLTVKQEFFTIISNAIFKRFLVAAA